MERREFFGKVFGRILGVVGLSKVKPDVYGGKSFSLRPKSFEVGLVKADVINPLLHEYKQPLDHILISQETYHDLIEWSNEKCLVSWNKLDFDEQWKLNG